MSLPYRQIQFVNACNACDKQRSENCQHFGCCLNAFAWPRHDVAEKGASTKFLIGPWSWLQEDSLTSMFLSSCLNPLVNVKCWSVWISCNCLESSWRHNKTTMYFTDPSTWGHKNIHVLRTITSKALWAVQRECLECCWYALGVGGGIGGLSGNSSGKLWFMPDFSWIYALMGKVPNWGNTGQCDQSSWGLWCVLNVV